MELCCLQKLCFGVIIYIYKLFERKVDDKINKYAAGFA